MADLKSILAAIDNAMITIKGIAETPGINMLPYVSVLSSVIGTVHAAYVAGQNVAPFIEAINATFSSDNPAPSEADMAALDAKIAELESAIDAPLPPKEDGEED